MNNESGGKMAMPNYIKVPIVQLLKEANDNLGTKREYIKSVARVNPFSISSYMSSRYGDEKDGNEEGGSSCVHFIVGGISLYADMSIEDFDELINSVDRSLVFKENKQD